MDDDKLFLVFQPCEILKAIQLLNLDLVKIARWCCLNSLLVNPDKTKLLVMGVPQLWRWLPPLSVTFLGKEISPVPVAKDLGVFIDKTLSYNKHISKTVSSCLYKLTQINRIKHLLDKKTLLLLLNNNQQSHIINILLASFARSVRQVMDPRFFLPCFHGPRTLRLGHKRKEKTRSITYRTDLALG